MSSTDWLSKDKAARLLCAQADALGKQLGHTLTSYVEHEGRYMARCISCYEVALVRPRTMHGAPLSGVALTFRCSGRPPRQAPATEQAPAPPPANAPHPWALALAKQRGFKIP